MLDVANKHHLNAIILPQRYLPLAAVGVERRTDVCFSERIDTLVNWRNQVRVLHLHRV